MVEGDFRSASNAVLTAVAEYEQVDVADLEPPLYTAIDTESLDSLFNDSSGEVTFQYRGHEVRVDSDYNVEISPAEE
jgi:hypothetical protein